MSGKGSKQGGLASGGVVTKRWGKTLVPLCDITEGLFLRPEQLMAGLVLKVEQQLN